MLCLCYCIALCKLCDCAVELSTEGVCVIADSPFLLYAKLSQIRSLELDASISKASHASSFQPVPIVTANEVISMDFDSREGYVYRVEQLNSRLSSEANQSKVRRFDLVNRINSLAYAVGCAAVCVSRTLVCFDTKITSEESSRCGSGSTHGKRNQCMQ